MAIALTSESARPPAALIDRDQMSIVELRKGDPKLVALVREAEDSEVKRGLVAAGGGRKGERAEYRCAACGYGIVVYGRPPGCPMCSEARWEHAEWRPFSQLARRLELTQIQEPTRTPFPNHSGAMPTRRSTSCRTGPGV